MKLHTPLYLFALVPLLAVSALAQDTATKTPPTPQPKLTSPAFAHSFGDVKPGTPLEYRFEIKNEGTADLRIEKVKAACGCTTVAYDTLVAPGKTGGITLKLKKTDTYKGAVEKTATVTTNDPEYASFKLILRATFPEK